MTRPNRRTGAWSIVRVVGIAAVLASLIVPQWIISAKYRPPKDPALDDARIPFPVEHRVVQDVLDVPATLASANSLVVKLPGVASVAAAGLRVAVGRPIASGQVVAVRQVTDESGDGPTRRPLFYLACAAAATGDVAPGQAAPVVGCLQQLLEAQGAALPASERSGSVLGPATQRALAGLYAGAGAAAVVASSGQAVKRLEADAAVLTAEGTLATAEAGLQAMPPSSTATDVEVARIDLEIATRQRDEVYAESGVHFMARDFVVAPPSAVTLQDVGGGSGADVELHLGWGPGVASAGLAATSWAAASKARSILVVAGAQRAAVHVVRSSITGTGDRHVLLQPAARDAAAFLTVMARGDAQARFVIRTTGRAVPSVPAVAVHVDRGGSFVETGSGRRTGRVPVTVVDEIDGRAILADRPALAKVRTVDVG